MFSGRCCHQRTKELGSSILGGPGWTLAPQSGHVSNFRNPVGPVIEPDDAPCFQSDRCDALTRVHAGHPVWTRLELAREAEIVSGCAVIQAQSASHTAYDR